MTEQPAAAGTDGDQTPSNAENEGTGSYVTDYVKIAAFLAGALAYGPVLNAWLSTIGARYYDVIMTGVGLSGNALELDERAMAAKGYELLVQATDPFVSGVVVGLPFAFFAGLILGVISAISDIRRKRQNLPRLDRTTAGGLVVSIGRVGFVAGSTLFILIAFMGAVFLAPGLANDSANSVLNCAKNIISTDCAPLFDYGDEARNARFLVADKGAAYVYQDHTLHRIKLEDAKAILSLARPKVSVTPKPGNRLPQRPR